MSAPENLARLTRANAACTLVHARHIFTTPGSWYQAKKKDAVPRGFFACMADGTDCWATDRFAVAFCPQGAIWRAAWLLGFATEQSVLRPDPPAVRVAFTWLARAIDPKGADLAPNPAAVISTWSDSPGLTRERLLFGFERACAIAQATITELDYPELVTVQTGEAA